MCLVFLFAFLLSRKDLRAVSVVDMRDLEENISDVLQAEFDENFLATTNVQPKSSRALLSTRENASTGRTFS